MGNKKAVFAYSFSMINAGDFSLNIAAVSILIENGFDVIIISRFDERSSEFQETNAYFKNAHGKRVKMISSPFKLDRGAGTARKLLYYLHSILVLFGLIPNKAIRDEVKSADLVVLCGGNILRCSNLTDYMRLQALNYPLRLAVKLSKKYLIFPQSTIEVNSLGKRLLGRMVNRAEVVFLRENLSYNKISNLYPRANTVETIDLAFFLLDEKRFKKGNEKKAVAFTIRAGKVAGIGELSTSEKNEISSMIVNAVVELNNSCSITFIIQGDPQDKQITHKIKNDLLSNYNIEIDIIEEHDTYSLIELYSEFDLLIGMRLHSIILAAIAGTPSYGLFRKEWGLKNPGIMKHMNLPLSFVDDGNGVDFEKIKYLLNIKPEFQEHIKKLVCTEKGVFKRVLDVK